MLSERDKKYLLKLKTQIITNCSKCQGKSTKCSCIDIFRLEFKKLKANIARKYRTLTFDDITHPQTIQVRAEVKKFIDTIPFQLDNGKGLYLYGSTGLAKTGLACIVLMEAFKHRYTGYFSTLNQCVDLYADGWKDERARQKYEEKILGTELLVIDEVGNESKTNMTLVSGCFNDILRQRAGNMYSTIVTSNLYFHKVKQIYGEEVFSILNETCSVHEFKGIDFRQGMRSV